MSFEAVEWVFKHSESKGSARTVLLAIANWTDQVGEGWSYVDTILEYANVSEDTYRRAMQWAEENGECFRIAREGGRSDMNKDHRPNLFSFPALGGRVPAGHEGGNLPPSQDAGEGPQQDAGEGSPASCGGLREPKVDPKEDPVNPPTPHPSGGDLDEVDEPSGVSLPSPERSSTIGIESEVWTQGQKTWNERDVGTVAEVAFAAWLEATGRDPARTKLTTKRRRCVGARLREGFPPCDVVAACRGIARSPWHMGENPNGTLYNDMDLILRDGGKLERFRDLWENPEPTNRRLTGRRSAVDRVMDELDRMEG